MKRLVATIRCDVQIQFRNGFYYATAFVLVIWALLLHQLHSQSLDVTTRLNLTLDWLLPAVVLNNLVITTFYFVGGLVLLEKSQGTLQAQVVTPLRTGEYLFSKVITLSALALIHNLIIVMLIEGLTWSIVPLITGITLASIIYVLVGFVAVARYDSVNEYLLPSMLYTGVLLMPLVYAAGWETWLLYLHPLQAPLVLMQAGFQSMEVWQFVYGLLYSALWIAIAYRFSQDAFQRFVIAGQGGD